MHHHHPSLQLSCHPGAPLGQHLKNYLHHQGRDLSGRSDHTRSCPRRLWCTLSPLWRSHGHAHHSDPRSDPHGHQPVSLARIHGLCSTIDLILQCGRLCAYERTTLVSEPLSSRPSIEPTQHPILTFTNPGPVRFTKLHHLSDCPATSPSSPLSASPLRFPTKNPSDPPSQGLFRFPNSLPDPPAGVQSKFPTNNPSISPIRGSSIFSNQTSLHITHLGSIPKCPRKPPCPDPSSHSVPAQEKLYHNTQAARILQKHAQITPSHIPNLPPIIFYQQHSFHFYHPYSISHMGYTRPPGWPQRSHCTRHRGWIPLLVLVPDTSVYTVIHRG